MNTSDAVSMARALLRVHGLNDWVIELDTRSRQRFGVCRHRDRTIKLSEHLVKLNTQDRVRQTILHEIAHALVGPGHGHDFVWKAKARSLGISDARCWSEADTVAAPAPVEGTCSCPTQVYKRYRMPNRGSRLICKRCRALVAWRRVA